MLGLETTSFVGRRRELDEVAGALERSRLVTLTGPGGVGKTRLALELARRWDDDPWWTVDLALLDDPSLVATEVARALGVSSAHRPVDAAVTFLEDQDGLLLLDNCEHVLAGAVPWVATVLEQCPKIRILTTSRHRLDTPHEEVFPVLPLEAVEDLPSPAGWSAEASTHRAAAVQLFLDRAALAAPELMPTPQEEAAVVRLCQELDGLPLAIEMAASRLRVLSPHSLAERVEVQRELLSRTHRAPGERHASLHASIEWSFQLCTPEEQRLWQRLSVFRGGFETAAAEHVCSDDQLTPAEVRQALPGLASKSVLLTGSEQPEVYQMLRTVRSFGADKLRESGSTAGWRERHAGWFADLGRQFAKEWSGPGQGRWISRLQRSHANLQQVLDVAPDSALAPTAFRLALDLENYWLVSRQLTEARSYLDRLLPCADLAASERAVGLLLSAHFAASQVETDVAACYLEEARTVIADAALHADPCVQFHLSFTQGLVAMLEGDLEGGIQSVRLARETARQHEDLGGELAAAVALALALSAVGPPDEARQVKDDILARTEACGESFLRSHALWSRGLDLRDSGDLPGARSALLASLHLKSELADDLGTGLVLEALATIASTRHEKERSAVLLGAAQRIWSRIGAAPVSARYIAAQRELAERITRGDLTDAGFLGAYRKGHSLGASEVKAFALGEELPEHALERRPLSAREYDVALLVGQGLTNRQIAEHLSLSIRTVQGHMENILRKLHFSSRTQVAGWVARRGT